MRELEVAESIARLSTDEIASAVRAPGFLRLPLTALASVPSARLGRLLARFDAEIEELGLARAAAGVLARLGARLRVEGACAACGPVLVVTNHPGAYDALATMAAIGRDDVALVAADRPFLRAMPHLAEHLVFVDDTAVRARARGTRRALDWLAAGKVLVQYGAGAIEPDARFAGPGEAVLLPWGDGTGLLASRAGKLGARVVPLFVSGVHSPRAKRLAVVRLAERRGITTIAPLIQATLPGFRDVEVRVRFGLPLEETSTEGLRDAVTRLRP